VAMGDKETLGLQLGVCCTSGMNPRSLTKR